MMFLLLRHAHVAAAGRRHEPWSRGASPATNAADPRRASRRSRRTFTAHDADAGVQPRATMLELRPRRGAPAGADLFAAPQPACRRRAVATVVGRRRSWSLALPPALVDRARAADPAATTHASNRRRPASPPAACRRVPLELRRARARTRRRSPDRARHRPQPGVGRGGRSAHRGRLPVQPRRRLPVERPRRRRNRSALRPGGESTFVVTVPGAADVGTLPRELPDRRPRRAARRST